jgi:hypothetical protein
VAGLHNEIDALRDEGEALADSMGDRSLKALLLGAYAPTKLVGGNLQEGLEIPRRAMTLAEETGDRATQLMIVPGVAYPLRLLGGLRSRSRSPSTRSIWPPGTGRWALGLGGRDPMAGLKCGGPAR